MSEKHTPGQRVAYEIWIKNDPERTDGIVCDTQCTIRSRDGAWTPMRRTTEVALLLAKATGSAAP